MINLKNAQFLPLVLLLMMMASFATAQENEWKLRRKTDDITVYYRKAMDSPINELKMVTTIDASLSTIVSVFRDVPALTEWVYKCIEARRVHEINQKEGFVYVQMDFPWPVSNRDFVAKAELSQDPETRAITSTLSRSEGYVPELKGIVRIPKIEIKWLFTPMENGQVRIDYFLASDPGGDVPAWLINMAIEKGPMASIRGLKAMVKKDKYRNSKIAYIQDFR